MPEKVSLEDQFLDDYRKALKKGNKIEIACIRLLRSEIKNKEIEKKSKLNDEEIIQILRSTLKKEHESLDFFVKGKRKSLAEQTKEEISVIKRYLPVDLSLEEIERIARKLILENQLKGLKDIGPTMKWTMGIVQGRAEGKIVSQIVKKILQENEI